MIKLVILIQKPLEKRRDLPGMFVAVQGSEVIIHQTWMEHRHNVTMCRFVVLVMLFPGNHALFPALLNQMCLCTIN